MTELQAGWTSYSEYRMRFEGEEQRERQEWERTRWMAFLMMQMHPYMKKKPNTPQEMIRFPWEGEKQKQIEGWQTSEEESQRLRDIIEDYRNRHGQDR